ncbi:MAG: hypothetical protein NW215_15750 [Hyphomicrobiales bacterium]|nr:hypothetical protein [Hyphomicrobiales bacterium]
MSMSIFHRGRVAILAGVAALGAVAGFNDPAKSFDGKPTGAESLIQEVQYGGRDREERRDDRDRGGDDRFEERFRDGEGEWIQLGKRRVGFLTDRDIIDVGMREGRFDRLLFQVRRSDIEILDLRVVYGNNQAEELRVRQVIPEGGRTRPIELRSWAGEGRFIKQIEVIYRSRPSFRGEAVLVVYGRQAAARQELTDGKKAGCETYANLAVVQAEANDKYRCGYRGGEWSDNKRGHYEWCLRNKRDFMADEIRYRAVQLQNCFNRLGDYDDENYDRGYTRRRF